MNPAVLYEESTVREWFVRDRRGGIHHCRDENEAMFLACEDVGSVVLWRDVVTGPLTVSGDQPCQSC